jgi:hypothetical protein
MQESIVKASVRKSFPKMLDEMKSLRRNFDDEFTTISGSVTTTLETGKYSVLARGDVYISECAASCFLVPQVGDKVLVAIGENQAWITCILSSKTQGAVLIQAEKCQFISNDLSISSNTYTTNSKTWLATHGALHYLGSTIQSRVGQLDWIGQKLTSLVDQMLPVHAESCVSLLS